MHPAAGALDAGGFLDGHGQAVVVRAGGGHGLGVDLVILGDETLGDDQQLLQIHAREPVDDGPALALCAQGDGGLKGLADALVGAGALQNAVYVVPDGDERVPIGHGGLVEGVLGEGLVHLVEHDVPRVVLGAVGHRQPDLIAGEGEDGREHLGQGVEDEEQRGLSRAALEAVCLLAVEPVLDDVEIEV